jgi:predicted methyltransferase
MPQGNAHRPTGGQPTFSAFQARPLIEARRLNQRLVDSSIDLGLSRTKTALTPEGAVFSNHVQLTWPQIKAIAKSTKTCFRLEGGDLIKIKAFSEESGRTYSLMPTEQAPTLLVSGFLMHRVKGTNPVADTYAKIESIQPILGQVLDTATGLGYTAIAAARRARHVISIELDPTVHTIARSNPWSQTLFSAANIELLVGDSSQVVTTLPSKSIDRIIHDPPAISLAGDLYAGAFYRQLFRLLKSEGRLFHYIGNLESPMGKKFLPGILNRLRQAGFRKIRPYNQAFGVIAAKTGHTRKRRR